MLDNVTQQPTESKKYTVDYSQWLDTDNGELLSAVNVSVSPVTNPPLRTLSTLDATQTKVLLTVLDGEAGEQYQVKILVTTTFNQRDQDCLGVTITDQC